MSDRRSHSADPCPICAAATREYCRKKAYGTEWIVRRCAACRHGFVANRPTLDRLRQIYAQSDHLAYGEISIDSFRRNRNCAELIGRLAAVTPLRGAAIDVGSGEGGFSYHLAMHGFGPLMMVDLDPRSADAAALIPDCEFRQCAFEDLDMGGAGVSPASGRDGRSPPGPFAAIVMSQILEHALDPVSWLRRARELLLPKGILAIALPNFGGIYRLLGQRDPMIIPPIHLNYFTLRSLRLALELAGLEIVSWRTASRVRVSREGKRLSAKRRALGRMWNTAAFILNPTPWGIILNVYAVRSQHLAPRL